MWHKLKFGRGPRFIIMLTSGGSPLAFPPPIPLKLWEWSEARRTAKCMPIPEEQPVMSTTVRSMWNSAKVQSK